MNKVKVSVVVSKTGIGFGFLGVLLYILGLGITLLYPEPAYTGDLVSYAADAKRYADIISTAGWLIIIGFLIFAFATLLTISFLKAKTREVRTSPQAEDIRPAAIPKACPKCNSADTTVYPDGSGFCHTCDSAFRGGNG